MPLPISTTSLVAALCLSSYKSLVLHVVVYILVGLALVNELLRTFFTRQRPTVASTEYTIPGAPRTVPNPLVDHDAS